jgi:hypothetical protein
MMKNTCRLLPSAILLVLNSLICPGQNTWVQKADFGGLSSHLAVGTKGYIGTGLYDGDK